MLFLNLVVGDLARSRAFFEGLGLSFNPQFTSDEAGCMVVSELAFVMLHSPASMARFSALPPADPRAAISGIYALSASSRAEVDALADQALATGGAPCNPPQDHGFMYLRSFRDPDGHPWEVFWMNQAHVQG
jgi:predicted lactoylglutathione lyase